MAERINSYRDLRVYKAVIGAAMDIFEITKKFPPELLSSQNLVIPKQKHAKHKCGWKSLL